MDSLIILGRCNTGLVATLPEYDWSWFLTDCCAASAKGSSNSPTGVCCRACYAEVDASLGGIYGERFDGPIQPLDAEDRALLAGHDVVFAETAGV